MPDDTTRGDRRTAVVTLAFATTVLMWFLGYACHMPLVQASGPVTLSLLLAALLAGGWVTGRCLGGMRAGAAVGLLAGILNLLVLGSLLKRGEDAGAISPTALLWAPGFLLASSLVGVLGAACAGAAPGVVASAGIWRGRLALVCVVATGLLVVAGGLVTGSEAGLAVDDWPTSFASNMFLLPLARMTGAVFYEHSHRLVGALVGLTTVVLAVVLWRGDERRWLRWLALAAVVLVVTQGVLGGLRVLAASPAAGGVAHVGAGDETQTSITLRVVHGVVAQLFLVLVVGLAAFTSRGWRVLPGAEEHAEALRTRRLGWLGSGLLVIQLVLGAVVRHLGAIDADLRQAVLVAHLCLAVLLAPYLVLVGSRVWNHHHGRPVLGTLAPAIVLLTVAQVLLGVAALTVTSGAGTTLAVNATVTTLHQATGAGLLALLTLLALWSGRLLRPTVPADA